MNYYEHHIGDFLKKTAHLTAVEDGIYRRLLDRYYTTEVALPTDLRECCKLARAVSKGERDAVKDVLKEFFVLQEDGHHQTRADEEIAKYAAKRPEREARRENDAERQKRARDRRKSLFDLLRGHDIVPAFDAKNHELESMLSRVTNTDESRGRHGTVTRDNTATQSPVPSPQLRNTGKLSLAPALPPEDRPPPVRIETDPETPKPREVWESPNCPHADVLALWAEVLPAMPQHLPSQWRGARADHLRARWRETAAEKRWQSPAEGLAYLRKLFAYCGQSKFLTGQAVQHDAAKRPFVMELEWLVTPGNWAKVIEGKYHQETAA